MMLNMLKRVADTPVVDSARNWRLRESVQRLLGASEYTSLLEEPPVEKMEVRSRHSSVGSFKTTRDEFLSIDLDDDDDFFNNSSKLLDSDNEEEYGGVSGGNNSVIPYPKSVFFIVTTEFCERFSFYGMRAILTLYMKYVLQYTEDKATVIFHAWSMLCYFTPILGALMADLKLGRYRTIFLMSVVYLLGNTVVAVSSIQPILPTVNAQSGVAMFGLILVAIGTGGIKPCVSAFGGDQFVVPQQERQLNQFFSIFYFSINAGAMLSTLITPVLREETKCFGGDCYFAAFGLPAILMTVALIVFVMGSSTYKKLPATGTVMTSTINCIWLGVKGKLKSLRGAAPKTPHWLDHARKTHSNDMVDDVRSFTSILLLFLPLPFFWALFDQQGSRWTFQASRLDGTFGNTQIMPDQMQMLNPLFILLLIPFMEKVGYPLLARCNLLTNPLHRVTVGGVMAGCSFFAAAILESAITNNPNEKLSMFWMLPQYFLITLGEVMFSVSGLQFSFTEAPDNLKSVMQASWLLTVSFGNLIVVFVAEADSLQSQTQEFALFAALMMLDMIIFGFLCKFYKPYKGAKTNDSDISPPVRPTNMPPVEFFDFDDTDDDSVFSSTETKN